MFQHALNKYKNFIFKPCLYDIAIQCNILCYLIRLVVMTVESKINEALKMKSVKIWL